ncbi:MAG: DUF4157 domain-containing protein [Planctomycetota bacterium]|nr:MAG: DUF4157 domain-containing protein [Planctomycetota bacterium]
MRALLRKCACGGTCDRCRGERELRRAPAARSAPREAPAIVHEVLRAPGHPLDPGVRAGMEARLGHDFGSVRVHEDVRAAESAAAVSALAYTVGRDIVFGSGQHDPHSPAGQRLLAHELAHVAQQTEAPSAAGSRLRVSEPGEAAERQADAMSRAVMAGGRVAAPAAAAGARLQRQPEEEGGGLTPPLWQYGGPVFRIREDGRMEIFYRTPDMPVTGPLGPGVRCDWGFANCTPVIAQDPLAVDPEKFTLGESYSPADIGRLLRDFGQGSGTTTATPLLPWPPAGPTPPLPGFGTPWAPSLPGLGGMQPAPAPGPLALPPQTPSFESRTVEGFAFNSAALPAGAAAALDAIVERANAQVEPPPFVFVYGHTDARGSERRNVQLGERRAEAIAAELEARGIVRERLAIRSFGMSEPAVAGARTEDEHAQNRRVEVWFKRTGTLLWRSELFPDLELRVPSRLFPPAPDQP